MPPERGVGLELALKASLGELTFAVPISEFVVRALNEHGLAALPVTVRHALGVFDLPWHHRDPFDRLLVAQALAENCTIVTADESLARYAVPTLW